MSKLLKPVSAIQGSGTPLLSILDLSSADATDEFPITSISKKIRKNRSGYDGYNNQNVETPSAIEVHAFAIIRHSNEQTRHPVS